MVLPKSAGLILLLLLTAWVYAPVASADFVYEDRNPRAEREGRQVALDNREAWQGWESEKPRFRPMPRMLTTLTMRLQGGSEAGVYHAGNVAIHLLNGGLLYALALGALSPLAAWLATAVFLLHPIQTEAVAYVSSRTDLLVMTAILCLLLATRAKGALGVALVTLCGIAAVLAKESGVVVVALLPIWLLWRGDWARRWLIPIGIWCGGGIALAVYLLPKMHDYTAPAPHGPFWFVAVQAAALWRLVALVVVPMGFTIDHDWDLVTQPLALAALAALVAVAVVAWRARRAAPMFAFTVAWVLCTIAPRFLIHLPDFLNEHQAMVAMLAPSLFIGHALVGGRPCV